MNFVSTRLITNDIKRLVAFYEKITSLRARWLNEVFAEVGTPGGTLAIGAAETRKLFGAEGITPASNQSAIIEFKVDDVDEDYRRLEGELGDVLQKPTTMPWGNRSFLFRDPDGNLVNFFTPVSEQAKQKYGIA